MFSKWVYLFLIFYCYYDLGIDEIIILQIMDNFKNIIIFNFKEIVWYKKDLEAKIKVRYYKEVINPNLEDQSYFLVLTSSNVAKIRTKLSWLGNG